MNETIRNVRVATRADDDKNDQIRCSGDPEENVDEFPVTCGTGGDAAVEEEHGELQAPEQAGVHVPRRQFQLGSEDQSRDFFFRQTFGVLDANILTGEVDKIHQPCVHCEENERANGNPVISLEALDPYDSNARTKAREDDHCAENEPHLLEKLAGWPRFTTKSHQHTQSSMAKAGSFMAAVKYERSDNCEKDRRFRKE